MKVPTAEAILASLRHEHGDLTEEVASVVVEFRGTDNPLIEWPVWPLAEVLAGLRESSLPEIRLTARACDGEGGLLSYVDIHINAEGTAFLTTWEYGLGWTTAVEPFSLTESDQELLAQQPPFRREVLVNVLRQNSGMNLKKLIEESEAYGF